MSILRRAISFFIAWGLPLVAALTLLGVLADHVGIGRSLNDLAYDQFVRMDAKLSFAPTQVLLVYADSEYERSPDEYLRLLKQLQELGATAVGVTTLDARNWSGEQLRELALTPNLVVGAIRSAAASLPTEMKLGHVELSQAVDGVHRRLAARNAGGRPLLEWMLVNEFGDKDLALPNGEFGVAFRGGAESLPHVAADAVLSGDVTSTLVRDRYVLVGPPPHPMLPGIATPTTAGAGMDVLEFHGQALNTLLNEVALQPAPVWMTYALYGSVALLFLTLARRTHLDQAIPLFLIVWTLQGIGEMLLVWRGRIWIPVLSLMVIEMLAGIWSFDQRMRYAERVWQLMRRRGFSVSPRYKNHPHLDAGTEPWPQVMSLFQHLFPVDRVAILVCVHGRETLELVGRAGVSEEDIIERRRDIRREPYADSIDRKTPMRIDETRPFFQRMPDQCQFIAPFLHAGAVKGVVVLEMSLAARDKLPGFMQQLIAVCEEISPWLAYYDHLTLVESDHSRWWCRLSRSTEEDTVERLQRHLRSIERRLHQSYGVIESSTSGKAVFDLGGNVVTMNASMFRMMHSFGMASMEVKLLQVIRTLSKRDVSECRDLLRRVIVQGRRERLIVTDHAGSHPMVLVVQSLVKSSQVANEPDEMHVFQAHGVQLEVLEGTLLSEMHAVRDHITHEGLDAVDQVLADVLALCDDVAERGDDATTHQMQITVNQAKLTVQSCLTMLANGDSEEVDVCLPVELHSIVAATLTETQSLAEQRITTVSTALPKELPDVVANPHRLRQSLNTIIEVMIENARENSLINISAKCEVDRVVLSIENEGCGVAFDQLVAVRRGRPDQTPSDISSLNRIRDWVGRWGGELTVESELGEGAVIQLALSRFDWSKHLLPDQEQKQIGRQAREAVDVQRD